MKTYSLKLPNNSNIKGKENEIMEYLIIQHWKDHLLSSGACAIMLRTEKFIFQTEILSKHGISFME